MLVFKNEKGIYTLCTCIKGELESDKSTDIKYIMQMAKKKLKDDSRNGYGNFKIRNGYFLWKAYNENIKDETEKYYITDGYVVIVNEYGEVENNINTEKRKSIQNEKKVYSIDRYNYIRGIIDPFSYDIQKKKNDILSLTALEKPIRVDGDDSSTLSLIGNYGSLIYTTNRRYYQCDVSNTCGVIDLEGVQCDNVHIFRNKGLKEIKLSKATKYLVLENIGDKVEELSNIIKSDNLEEITITCDCEIESINMPNIRIEIKDDIGYLENIKIEKIKCKELIIRNNATKLKEMSVNIDKIKTEKLVLEEGIYNVNINEIIAKEITPSRWFGTRESKEIEKIKLNVEKVNVGIIKIKGNTKVKIKSGYIDVIRFCANYTVSLMPIEININAIGEGTVEKYIQYDSKRPDIEGVGINIYRNGIRATKLNTKRVY